MSHRTRLFALLRFFVEKCVIYLQTVCCHIAEEGDVCETVYETSH